MSEPAEGATTGGAPGSVPVCPRHPDRESYVRCQRCERPVCPECQRPAAVGIQCVDCVRQQSRTARPVRTVFGGGVAGTKPRVTQGIIVVCVIMYLFQIVPGSTVTDKLSFVPAYALAEPWRFLTSAFLHAPRVPLHIAFNMYALWLVGPYLESLFGRVRFLVLYLVAAFGGSVFFLLLASPFHPQQWLGGAVGASGAVFGLFAALVVVQRRLGREARGVIVVIAINALLSFIPGIAWQAHLGGLLTGGAVAAVLAYAPAGPRRKLVQVVGVVGVIAVLLALVAYKVATVPSAAFF